MINADNILLPLSQPLKIFSSPTLHLFVLRVPSMIILPILMGYKKRKEKEDKCNVLFFSLSVKIASPEKF